MENEMLKQQVLALQQENARLLSALGEQARENEQAKAFLHQFPLAEEFIDDICCELDKRGVADENALLYAYAQVLSAKYKTPQSLVDDEEFLAQNVYPNEKIREFFIKEFLEKAKRAPIGCLKRGGIPTTSAQKPKTIASAGEMARALFRKQ